MKALHRPDLYAWSTFDAARNVDFHTVVWARPGGNVVVDPLPLSDHDRQHLLSLGGAAWIVITNGDHVRDAAALVDLTGAEVAAPKGEEGALPIRVDRWLADGDELVPGLVALALEGSKTPGELALVLEGRTLITGDLVRAHRAGSLMMLPAEKLRDRGGAARSVARLAELDVDTVLVGDGWPVFRDGRTLLRELAARVG